MKVHINVGTEIMMAAQTHADALAPELTNDGTFVILNIPGESSDGDAKAIVDAAVAKIEQFMEVPLEEVTPGLAQLRRLVMASESDVAHIYVSRAIAAKVSGLTDAEAVAISSGSHLNAEQHTASEGASQQLSSETPEELHSEQAQDENSNQPSDGDNAGLVGHGKRSGKR